jgi:hypothetical protein
MHTLRKKQKNYTAKYTESQYNSQNGFFPSVWGPATWLLLHTISFNYPNKPTDLQKKQYRDFVISLQNVLPCGKCRSNLSKNFKKLPLTEADMKNRDTFSRYIYNFHEVVNTMLNKKSNLSYEEVHDRFELFRAQCSSAKKNKTQKKTHKGCSEAIPGHIKTKCVIKIVPKNEKCETLSINKKCIPRTK